MWNCEGIVGKGDKGGIEVEEMDGAWIDQNTSYECSKFFF